MNEDFMKNFAESMAAAMNMQQAAMANMGLYSDADELTKALTEIESRGNYAEMSDVLLANKKFRNDADYALFSLKCVIHGGLKAGEDKALCEYLESLYADNSVISGGGFVAKLANKALSKLSEKELVTAQNEIRIMTNKFFIESIRGVLTYGNNEYIGKVVELTTPIFAKVKNLKNYKYDFYTVFLPPMCVIGDAIADIAVSTNKQNFPAVKNLAGVFKENVIDVLIKPLGGLFGFPATADEKRAIKSTCNKLGSLQ